MEKYSEKDIEWLLNLHKGTDTKRKPETRKGWKQVLIKFGLVVTGIIILIVFPFLLLIRTSVNLNVHVGFSAWPAVGGGVLATVLLLLGYLLLLFRKVKNKKKLVKTGIASASVVVIGFCLFSLFYLSGVHAKNDTVQELYRSMHPILRIAISTATLADHGLVVTDIKRFEGDYKRMGLPENPSSLHYQQSDGYVYAVDIRTLGRGSVRNFLLQGSLELMGFKTLRHSGTADHLHVELRRTP